MGYVNMKYVSYFWVFILKQQKQTNNIFLAENRLGVWIPLNTLLIHYSLPRPHTHRDALGMGKGLNHGIAWGIGQGLQLLGAT